jgi:hypothetical protein
MMSNLYSVSPILVEQALTLFCSKVILLKCMVNGVSNPATLLRLQLHQFAFTYLVTEKVAMAQLTSTSADHYEAIDPPNLQDTN